MSPRRPCPDVSGQLAALEATNAQQEAMIAELRAQLEQAQEPEPEPPPPPPTGAQPLLTADDLTRACVGPDGAVYQLQEGVEYAGNFQMRAKNVTLQGVPVTRRVTPDEVSRIQLTPKDMLWPALHIHGNGTKCSGFRVNGSGFANDPRWGVRVGRYDETVLENQTKDVELIGLAIMGQPFGGDKGIDAHCGRILVQWCYVADWWNNYSESQGLAAVNGPGPYVILDSFFSASGEVIMFGGDDQRLTNVVPSDILIKGCDLYKKFEWVATAEVKNLLEFKNAQRVLVEDTVLDGNWKDAQDGSAILCTPRNPSGTDPWTIVDDITFRRVHLKNALTAYAVNVLGRSDKPEPYTTQQTRRLRFENCLFEGCTNGFRINRGVSDELAIINCTLPHITGNVLTFDVKPPLTRLRFENNVAQSGWYSILGAKSAEGETTVFGKAALDRYCEILGWSNNIIGKRKWAAWPEGTTQLEMAEFLARLDPVTYKYLPGGAGY